MEKAVDRFLLLIDAEDVKLPWLESVSGIPAKRWSNVKYKAAEMRAEELVALGRVFKEYAYWLTTGEEIPEVGQISPMTKRAQRSLKPTPEVG